MRPNLDAVRALIAREGLDALVCMSPENFTYISGAHISTIKSLRPRQGYVVVPRISAPFMVICSIEKSLAEEESWVEDIRLYTEFADNPIDALVAALEERQLGAAKLGFDLDYLPASSMGRLTEFLPRLTFSNTTEEIAAIRAIKTPDEIGILEGAARATHRAVLDAMAASRVGETEKVMSNRIANGIIDNGATGTLFVHFASGERSANVHGHAGDFETKESEIIRFDVGGTYGPWASDFARTYSTGNPTAMQREVYRKLCEVQEATIAAMRPGVPAEDIFFLCKGEFTKRGLPCFLPHIGHSFGVELHEAPMIRPGDKTPLKAGMAINIEPMTFDEDNNCYHTEDLVLITETGNRLLTLGLAPKEIPVIGVPLAI